MEKKILLLSLASLASAQSGAWGQCGGIGWTGDTTCVSGWTCVYQNDWYSQCLQDTSGSGSGTTTTPQTATTTSSSGSSSTSSSGGSGSNTCGSAAVNGLVGYGAGTTGGGSGSSTTVTSCSALESAIDAGTPVIKISGILSGCGILDVNGDSTIIGVGSNSGMTGGGLRAKRVSNVIIRNLKFHDAPEGKDQVEIQYSTKVWVDHCDFSSEGLTGDKDTYDGLLDITHGSSLITVSWNKFHDHWKCSLIGHSDSNADEDTGNLKVTYHHNWFYNCNSRLPSIRFGTGHIYSSCYEDNPGSGIHSRMGAQVLVESCYFDSTKLAIVTDRDSDEDGYAVQKNNVFVNSDTEITQTGSLTPPYSYTVDPASCVCDLVKSMAGTGVIG